MADGTWSVAEAKAKFSELLEKARSQGPQRVSRHGKAAVVVVSAEEWAKRGGMPNAPAPADAPKSSDAPVTLYEFFERSPLRGSGIRIERMKGKMRDLDF